MIARELLQAGNVAEALEQVKQDVIKSPQEASHRVFLFQLFALTGQWDRALKQLKLCGDLDPLAVPMVQCYQHLLDAEAFREQVFKGTKQPLIFGEPDGWIAGVLEASQLFCKGEAAVAEQLLHTALEEAPASAGTISTRQPGSDEKLEARFEWLMDADCRIGPFLETIVNGKYFWIPFQRIRKMEIAAPADLRDLVWTPCSFTWTTGGEMVGMVPSRYPGTQFEKDSGLLLSRKTTWAQQGEATQFGLGQRVLATDVDDYPLLNIASICFDAS